jgi:hypothetical protein
LLDGQWMELILPFLQILLFKKSNADHIRLII